MKKTEVSEIKKLVDSFQIEKVQNKHSNLSNPLCCVTGKIEQGLSTRNYKFTHQDISFISNFFSFFQDEELKQQYLNKVLEGLLLDKDDEEKYAQSCDLLAFIVYQVINNNREYYN